MKAVYLDTFSGISGNMLLGALLDAGFSADALTRELGKLSLGEYSLILEKVNKCGIEASYFNVLLPHEHESHGEEDFWHHHYHEEQDTCRHEEDTEAELQQEQAEPGVTAGHRHEHGHLHAQGQHHEHRNLRDIMAILDASDLSPAIREKAAKVFAALAAAEAKVHGKPLEEVHFHEVGAIDTIIDIVGCLLGLEYLGIEKLYVGRITTGCGYVNCAHGRMPVPAPATAELLLGMPQRRGAIARELTTPTGAALLKVLAEPAPELPAGFRAEAIAYGAGSWELETPNVLRMYLGEDDAPGEDALLEAACNIDDMGGEFFAHAIEKLLQGGALDAWAEPIIMKKGRPACKLVLLALPEKMPALLHTVFEETTTLGIRCHEVQRIALPREYLDVVLPQGTVTVKYARLHGRIVNIAPEYESCKAVAAAAGCPLQEIYTAAAIAARGALNE